jgi:hypothetical protein
MNEKERNILMEQNNTGVEYMNEYNRGGVAKATRHL